MELPSLRLTVEKGPRKGETLDCKPGNVARVGRVIRGNHLAVRDPGVSQKHLTFEFLPNGSRWAVSDLDTSNGTLVNGWKIPPSAPFPLSDGDTVKIGEATAISVKILAAEMRNLDEGRDEEEESSRLRPRRGRPRKCAPPLPAVEENAVNAANEVKILREKGRAKRRAAAVPANPKKDEILEPEIVEIVEESHEVEVVPVAKGRTRGRRTTTRSAAVRVSKNEEAMEHPHDLVPRAATAKSAAAMASEDEDVMDDPRDSVPVAAMTRSSAASKGSEDEKVEYPHDSVPVVNFKSVKAAAVVEMEEAAVGSDAAEKAAGDLGQEEPVQEEEREVAEDMEKMTLGEWFDRLEKILPLMINDVAQETIENLRDKAQRFDEFIATSSSAI